MTVWFPLKKLEFYNNMLLTPALEPNQFFVSAVCPYNGYSQRTRFFSILIDVEAAEMLQAFYLRTSHQHNLTAIAHRPETNIYYLADDEGFVSIAKICWQPPKQRRKKRFKSVRNQYLKKTVEGKANSGEELKEGKLPSGSIKDTSDQSNIEGSKPAKSPEEKLKDPTSSEKGKCMKSGKPGSARGKETLGEDESLSPCFFKREVMEPTLVLNSPVYFMKFCLTSNFLIVGDPVGMARILHPNNLHCLSEVSLPPLFTSTFFVEATHLKGIFYLF